MKPGRITAGLGIVPAAIGTYVMIKTSLMGGIGAIVPGFCRCVTRQTDEFEGLIPPRKPKPTS